MTFFFVDHERYPLNFEATGCSYGYMVHGNQKNEDIRELLSTERDVQSIKWNGHLVIWDYYEWQFYGIIYRCATLAARRGFQIFALSNYGKQICSDKNCPYMMLQMKRGNGPCDFIPG